MFDRIGNDRAAPAGRSAPPGPVAGLLLGAVLGVTVFFVATRFHDRVFGGKTPVARPPAFVQGRDARLDVRVLAALGGQGVRAVLLPLREDGAAAEAEEAIPPRQWARLLVSNPPGRPPYRVALGPRKILLDAGGVPVPNEDLAAAVAARLPALSPHRVLDLRVSHAADGEVEVPPGSFVRILVAFPGKAGVSGAAGAAFAGGPSLLPREVSVERLRAVLLDGRIDDLQGTGSSQARGRGGAGSRR